MKYLIPSKGRADTVGDTIDLLGKKNVKVYVATDQVDSYKKYLDKSLINVLPEGTIGMGAIRKHMLDDNRKLDFFYQLDDDIKYLADISGEKVEQIYDSDHIKSIITNVYQMAYDIQCPLFGLNPVANPKFVSQLDMVHFSKPVIMGIGVIPKYLGDINFDPRMKIYEDEDFTLTTKFIKRYNVVDLRYHFFDKKIWTSEGGCSTLRTQQIQNQCKTILLNKWGNAGKEDGQFIVSCPF